MKMMASSTKLTGNTSLILMILFIITFFFLLVFSFRDQISHIDLMTTSYRKQQKTTTTDQSDLDSMITRTVLFTEPPQPSPSPSPTSGSPAWKETDSPPAASVAPTNVDVTDRQRGNYDTNQTANATRIINKIMNISSKLEKLERGLARARAAIREAGRTRNYTAPHGLLLEEGYSDFVPMARLYRNPYAFYRSHMEMIKRFKVWTYKEGEPPLFHEGPTRSVYGIDGHFIDEISDNGKNSFIARHPDEAHSFFLPIGLLRIRKLVLFPNLPRLHMHRIAEDYVNLVARKYPYWNRSRGADHFVLSCHDWAPSVSKGNPKLMGNLIRALCNANMSEGFHPVRDVSIPEIKILSDQRLSPPSSSLGLPFSKRRRYLAFFAGRDHGYVRKLLFEHWKEKENENEVIVYEDMPKDKDYFKMMGESKFCLCPSGYEVASPRVVEAVHAGCVPVLISSNYYAPFEDVLDYTQFSIRIPLDKISEIKNTLKGVSDRDYARLVRGVKAVKRHFTLNRPTKPFDMIHMVLHSIWLRRLNLKLVEL